MRWILLFIVLMPTFCLPAVEFHDGLLTAQFENEKLGKITEQIEKECGVRIILEDPKISEQIINIHLEKASMNDVFKKIVSQMPAANYVFISDHSGNVKSVLISSNRPIDRKTGQGPAWSESMVQFDRENYDALYNPPPLPPLVLTYPNYSPPSYPGYNFYDRPFFSAYYPPIVNYRTPFFSRHYSFSHSMHYRHR
jgi:hypothetical protein